MSSTNLKPAINETLLIEGKQFFAARSATEKPPKLSQLYDQTKNYLEEEPAQLMSHVILRSNSFEPQSIMKVSNRSKRSYSVLTNSLLGLENPNAFHLILTQPPQSKKKTAWQILESLIGTVTAPPDWSINHDYYLYGGPKE